jgi:hypothetical protein
VLFRSLALLNGAAGKRMSRVGSSPSSVRDDAAADDDAGARRAGALAAFSSQRRAGATGTVNPALAAAKVAASSHALLRAPETPEVDSSGAAADVAAGRSSLARAQSRLDAGDGGGALDATGRRTFAATKPRSAPAAAAGDAEQPPPLLPGWVEVWSRSKNLPYWRHETSGDTVWERPSAPVALPPLLSGWTESWSKSQQAPYWTDEDGSVSWTRPSFQEGAAAPSADDFAARAAAEEAALPPLPDGWAATWSKSRLVFFYFKGDETTWVRPVADQEPLPDGWTAVWSKSRNCFYYRHADGVTIAWERPLFLLSSSSSS